jgi:hypothetical protein
MTMPVAIVYDTRIRVLCDGCRTESAEVYSAKDMPVMATVAALRKFKSAGWRNDSARNVRSSVRPKLQPEWDGWGRWYCPKCAGLTPRAAC